MAKRAAGAVLTGLVLDPQAPIPLYRQLFVGLREAILAGVLAPGTRLPSTRTLTAELGVSRTTVKSAFHQLLDEGYVQSRVGDGTYVADVLPEGFVEGVTAPRGRPQAAPLARRSLSQSGERLAALPLAPDPGVVCPFSLGLPALDAFPLALWQRLLARRARQAGPALLPYGDPLGYAPLRSVLAKHLATARGVRCAPGQILILSSSQQAIDLAVRVLLDPGDTVWMEEPGYAGARGVFGAAALRLAPVPVDEEGLDVDAGRARWSKARLAYVTPSHQFPTGSTLSLRRRLQLLAWAEEANAWILEDDYDSEFRYSGRPLEALQGLDPTGRVLYVGTFSKVLFPALRLAYLVAPPDLVGVFRTARILLDGHPPTYPQAVLADFMEAGHLASHIRAMRAVYEERRTALLAALQHHLADHLTIPPADTGLHLTAWLPEGADDQALARQAGTLGIDLSPVSRYYVGPERRQGFVFGYASVSPPIIRDAIHRLAPLFEG